MMEVLSGAGLKQLKTQGSGKVEDKKNQLSSTF